VQIILTCFGPFVRGAHSRKLAARPEKDTPIS
jgi:hypothetical protein